jgi:hypothetical protein
MLSIVGTWRLRCGPCQNWTSVAEGAILKISELHGFSSTKTENIEIENRDFGNSDAKIPKAAFSGALLPLPPKPNFLNYDLRITNYER